MIENPNSLSQKVESVQIFDKIILQESKLTIQVMRRLVDEIRHKKRENISISLPVKVQSLFLTISFSSLFTNGFHQSQTSMLINQALSHYSFINIMLLQLVNTEVQNCSFLAYLEAPRLRNILLTLNKIVSLKPLQRARLPSLLILTIQSNHVTDFHLQRMNMLIKAYSLILQSHRDSKVQLQDISRLVKLQPQNYDMFRVQSRERICQPKVYSKIMQRFQRYDKKSEGVIDVIIALAD